MKLPAFEYVAPSTPAEAVALLARHRGEAKVIAGGQSLLPAMAFRLAQPSLLVDLRKLDSLRRIRIDADGVTLGARTRWRDIEGDARLDTAQPLLKEAIRHVAHYQVRNRGTVGGSLAHADPAAEMPCIAVACDARLRILGPDGERCVPAADFFVGPLTTSLAEDEIILDVALPPWRAARRWAFLEFARRPGDFALAGVALHFDLDAEARATNAHLAVIGACYRPQRLPKSESALNGSVVDETVAREVARVAASECEPGSDIHASAEYRRALVATLAERALLAAARRT